MSLIGCFQLGLWVDWSLLGRFDWTQHPCLHSWEHHWSVISRVFTAFCLSSLYL